MLTKKLKTPGDYMNHFPKISILILLSALLFACSDNNPVVNHNPGNGDNNNPNTTETFFPMSQGNYWIYARQDLDSNNVPDKSVTYTDSVVIAGTTDKAGKTCNIQDIFRQGMNGNFTTD